MQGPGAENLSPPPGAGADCTPTSDLTTCCIRGTIGCHQPHTEPTLLERLDAAETDLRLAEHARKEAYALRMSMGPGAGVLVSKAETGSMVAAALCSAAAARCLVCVEEMPQ